MVSACSESSVLMAASALATILVAGMLVGVTAKFNPFSSNDTSASLRGRDDKLITHLFFVDFLRCLVNMRCSRNRNLFLLYKF